MVHRDTVFHDVQVQANEGDIDNDLIQEVKFYRQETARLQSELNSCKNKLRQAELSVKTTAKEKHDAMLLIEAFDK